jgi:hypothetical protein
MKRKRQQGYTLIELTLVMGLSMMIAGALAGMFQAHLQMMNQTVKYQFVAKDAPFIGLLLTRTIGNAEDYRIYSSRTAATSGGVPVLTGPVVRLWMRQPNSTFRQAVLSFETYNSRPGIYFFLADPTTGAFPAAPNWQLAGAQLSSASSATTFDASTGILLVTLNGKNNDWYKFAAEKK